MPLDHRRFPRPGSKSARRTAVALVAVAAWLAAAPSAVSQRGRTREPAPIEMPRLLNGDEIDSLGVALFPAPKPAPAGLLRLEVERNGHAWLKLRVLADGSVDPASVTVERSSRIAFDQPAVAIASRMRFTPARVGERAVAAWIHHGVSFSESKPEMDELGTYEMTGPPSRYHPATLRNHGEVARLIAAHYPPALRDAGVAGSVLLDFSVSEDGTVDSTSIRVELATDLALEEPAKAVARQMRFTPATVSGRRVLTRVRVPVHFGSVVPASGEERQ